MLEATCSREQPWKDIEDACQPNPVCVRAVGWGGSEKQARRQAHAAEEASKHKQLAQLCKQAQSAPGRRL
jgi:hypothetical protein